MIGGNERVVYYYINGKKTVRQLSYASCLGEFDTHVALVRLFDEGFIEVVTERGEGEARRNKRVLLPTAFRALAYGLTAILVTALVIFRPGALENPSDLISLVPPELEARLTAQARAQVEHALDIFLVTEGHYPAELGELCDAKLLTADELSSAGLSGYQATGEPARGYGWNGH